MNTYDSPAGRIGRYAGRQEKRRARKQPAQPTGTGGLGIIEAKRQAAPKGKRRWAGKPAR